jgi:NADPH:quinone reductase-like Zn-dependent oxidoreductase
VHTSHIHCATPNPEQPIIILADIKSPIFCDMTTEKLRCLQAVTCSVATVILITNGALLKGSRPEHEMARGWARVLRNENQRLNLRLVDIDDCTASKERLRDVILRILECWTRKQEHDRQEETEYCISEGSVHISRVVPAHDINVSFASSLEHTKLVDMCDAPPLTAVSASGKVSFCRDLQKDLEVALAPMDIEIAIRAIGLNQEDASVACGTEPSPYFSHEVAGTVTAIGTAVPHGLAVGDRVFGFSFNTMATVQRTRFDLVQTISDDEQYEEMAALPMACATALHGIEYLARVEAEDTVVVLDGCGVAGLVAAQVCAGIGARTIVVTDSIFTDRLFRSLQIPHVAVVRFDQEDVFGALNRLNLNTGVDVIFSCKSSPPQQIEVCSRALAPFGRIVRYGEQEHSRTSSTSVARHATILDFDVRDLYEHKPHYLARYLQRARDLFREGVVRQISPLTIKSLADTKEAFRSLSTQEGNGKMVISYNPAEKITYHESRKSLCLSPTATYLLVGCLGGLGRSLVMWMVERGARHLAFLSRNGTDNPAAADLVAMIEQQGAKTYVLRANAAHKKQVEEVIARIDANHPVRGVVNAAAVFRDSVFQNMGLDSWQDVLEPKVKASRILHEVFDQRDELDFFVMTSSVAEITGGAGQSNYAAGRSTPCRYKGLVARG